MIIHVNLDDSYIASDEDELEVLIKVNSDDEKPAVAYNKNLTKTKSKKPIDNKTDFDEESIEVAAESVKLLPEVFESMYNLNYIVQPMYKFYTPSK